MPVIGLFGRRIPTCARSCRTATRPSSISPARRSCSVARRRKTSAVPAGAPLAALWNAFAAATPRPEATRASPSLQ